MGALFFFIAQLAFVVCYRTGKSIASKSNGYEVFGTAVNGFLMMALVADLALIIWGFFVLPWWAPIASAFFAQIVGAIIAVLASKASRSPALIVISFLAGSGCAGLAYRFLS
jgi:uncharacterized ion transporter superfamily protein YfcC